VRPVVVVLVEPSCQRGSAGVFGAVELLVGPAVGEGAVESFDLAVGLRATGSCPLGCDPKIGAAVAPEV